MLSLRKVWALDVATLLCCTSLILNVNCLLNKTANGTEEVGIHDDGSMLSEPDMWCQRPNFDPMTWPTNHTEPLPNPIKCKMEEYSKVSEGMLLIDNAKLFNLAREHYPWQGIECCMHDVLRGSINSSDIKNIDVNFTLGPCKPISGPQMLSSEFVEVRCHVNGTEIYRNVHYSIAARTRNWTEKDYERFNRNGSLPSVLIVGIDSASRLNSMRYMPLLRSTMKKIGAVEMNMFNKIGTNSFANVMAMITGLEIKDARKSNPHKVAPKGSGCLPSDEHIFDDCPFIWDRFSSHGYVTLSTADEPRLSIFNNKRGGFHKVPVDFYSRPGFLAASKDLEVTEWKNREVCFGPIASNDMVLGYTMDGIRWASKNKVPFFALSWLSSRSHENKPSLSLEDKAVAEFIEEAASIKVDGGLLIIVMSDHGIRKGHLMKTDEGWFEDCTPFLFIKPPSGASNHPSLAINSRRLVSTFDIFVTLSSLIPGGVEINSCPKCFDLLTKEVPASRTCEDAGIPREWCACNYDHNDLDKDTIGIELASLLVSSINEFTKPHRKLCAPFMVSKIISARIFSEYVASVRFVVDPGSIVFEGRLVRHHYKAWNILIPIYRVSSYGETGDCVEDWTLSNYCYCLNKRS